MDKRKRGGVINGGEGARPPQNDDTLPGEAAHSRLSREQCGCTISSGNMTLASVVRQGSSVGFWKAIPAMLSGPVTSRPLTMTAPAVGGHKPVTTFIRVDLPHPDGPTTATNSPGATARVVPSSASVPSPSSP